MNMSRVFEYFDSIGCEHMSTYTSALHSTSGQHFLKLLLVTSTQHSTRESIRNNLLRVLLDPLHM